MEAIFFLMLLAILILVIAYGSQLKSKSEINTKQIADLWNAHNKQFQNSDRKFQEILQKLNSLSTIQKEGEIKEQVTEEKKADIPTGKVEQIVPPDTEKIPETKEKITDEKIKPEQPQIKKGPVAQELPLNVQRPVYVKKQVSTAPKKKTDFEKWVGEKLIIFIGIGILVLGVAFFVKWAIDNNWINEVGRVAIGILCGGILIGIAHNLRNRFRTFSSVLAGGGLATLYFTITFAFHEYQLFSQSVAFGIMVVITAFAVILSLAYDRKELAVLAILGGFATPLMVSTGSGNYKILFTYIMILDVGMLCLAYFKKWNLINIVSYFCTLLLYGAWLANRIVDTPDAPLNGALLFATLFYLVFFMMNIVNNVRQGEKFNAFDIIMLVSNTFFYYVAGMAIIYQMNPLYKGLFTAIMAVFNFVFAFILYRNKKIDTNLIYTLIALVLTFLALAVPVQFEGNYITLFWALEAVALLWLSQKSGIKVIKVGSALILFLMMISLFIDWVKVYGSPSFDSLLPILINKGFITSIVATGSMVLSFVLLKNDKDISLVRNMSITAFQNLLIVLIILSLYISCLLELNFQLQSRMESVPPRNVILGLYNFIYILGILIWSRYKMVKYVFEGITVIGSLGILSYLVFYHFQFINVRGSYLAGQIANSFLVFHYLTVASVLAITYFCWRNYQRMTGEQSILSRIFLWFAVFTGVFILSTDLDHIVLFNNYVEGFTIDSLLEQNRKIGYPILWGVISFTLIYFGMKKQYKDLRIISLALIFITLLKLFIIDLKNISTGGKVAAFVSLGIIIIVVAFLYQKRLKAQEEEDLKEKEKIEPTEKNI